MPIRCRCPPENACGLRRACSAVRPTLDQHLQRPLAALLAVADAVDPSGSSTIARQRSSAGRARRRDPGKRSACAAAGTAARLRRAVARSAPSNSTLPPLEVEQAHQAAGERRLAAPRLPDETEGLARAGRRTRCRPARSPRVAAEPVAASHHEAFCRSSAPRIGGPEPCAFATWASSSPTRGSRPHLGDPGLGEVALDRGRPGGPGTRCASGTCSWHWASSSAERAARLEGAAGSGGRPGQAGSRGSTEAARARAGRGGAPS